MGNYTNENFREKDKTYSIFIDIFVKNDLQRLQKKWNCLDKGKSNVNFLLGFNNIDSTTSTFGVQDFNWDNLFNGEIGNTIVDKGRFLNFIHSIPTCSITPVNKTTFCDEAYSISIEKTALDDFIKSIIQAEQNLGITKSNNSLSDEEPAYSIEECIARILGLPINSFEFKTVIEYKNTMMATDPLYTQVEDYRIYEFELAQALLNDPNALAVAQDLYNMYILRTTKCIQSGDTSSALFIYQGMMESLMSKYMAYNEKKVSESTKHPYLDKLKNFIKR